MNIIKEFANITSVINITKTITNYYILIIYNKLFSYLK